MHTHLPLAAKGVVVGDVGRVERLVVLQEMDEDTVDLMGGFATGHFFNLPRISRIDTKMASKISEIRAIRGKKVQRFLLHGCLWQKVSGSERMIRNWLR